MDETLEFHWSTMTTPGAPTMAKKLLKDRRFSVAVAEAVEDALHPSRSGRDRRQHIKSAREEHVRTDGGSCTILSLQAVTADYVRALVRFSNKDNQYLQGRT